MKFNREWEDIDENSDRLKVPGGWLVRCWVTNAGMSVIFYSDPHHEWTFEQPQYNVFALKN